MHQIDIHVHALHSFMRNKNTEDFAQYKAPLHSWGRVVCNMCNMIAIALLNKSNNWNVALKIKIKIAIN